MCLETENNHTEITPKSGTKETFDASYKFTLTLPFISPPSSEHSRVTGTDTNTPSSVSLLMQTVEKEMQPVNEAGGG